MALTPYFANSPQPNGKTPNLIHSLVLNGTLVLPVISIPKLDGIIQLNDGYNFPLRYPMLRSFVKTAYAAGTKGVYTINVASVVPTTGKAYKLTIITGDGSFTTTLIAIAPSASTTDLATAINTSLTNANASGIYTNTVLNNTVTITEANATTGGLTLIFSDTNAVVATSVSNVQPFGTVAQVALYNSSVTSGTYNRYQFGFYAKDLNFQGTGKNADELVFVEVWVDTGATGYSTADAELTQWSPTGNYWTSAYSNILALPNI